MQNHDDDDQKLRLFHSYRWDLDKDFLGGVVLALGGYKSLKRTRSQADIILHSRTFYYERVKGVQVWYLAYKKWLTANPSLKVWEWDLLETLCDYRDKIDEAKLGAFPPASISDKAAGVEEKARWMKNLISDDDYDSVANFEKPVPAAVPTWQTTAPKRALLVDRSAVADSEDGSDVPYPQRFAQIIQALKTGGQVEGIVEIPDIVARDQNATPFGKMAAPPKPWEKKPNPIARKPVHGEDGFAPVNKKFPDAEEPVFKEPSA